MKESFIFQGEEQRIDVFLAENIDLSRSKIKSLIKLGKCKVNGKNVKPSYLLKTGDKIDLIIPEEKNSLEPKKGELEIIAKEKYFLVLNKPYGLSVHPAPSEKEDTLVNFLLYHFPQLKNIDSERPGIVHRLDKDTSGLILVALNEKYRLILSDLFAKRQVDKEYLALVKGNVSKPEGIIDLPIGRDPKTKVKQAVVKKGGKEAKTKYKVLWSDGRYSLLKVKIFTGRTHQIRVHLSYLGYPIVGDELYGGKIDKPSDRREYLLSKLVKRQFLHAYYLAFTLDEQKKAYRVPLPADLKRVLLFLLKKSLKVVLVGLPGSGKSTVARFLTPFVFDADEEVKKLYEPGADGYFLLSKMFGDKLLDTNKKIDKDKLFKLLKEPGVKREVEKFIHPLVIARWKNFQQEHSLQPVIVGDIPLYLECNLKETDVFLVGIKRSQQKRWQALKQRGWSKEKIEFLESNQLAWEKKLRQCHFILSNEGDLAELKNKVVALKKILLELKRKKFKSSLKFLDGVL